MHHIKHIKNYKQAAFQGFLKIVGILTRKQIPVCSFHRNLIHTGKYDSADLTELYDTKIAILENYLKLYKKDKDN